MICGDSSNIGIVEIVSQFEKKTPIPRDKIRQWMQSADIEVLGALYALIVKREHYTRIDPSLSVEDYYSFLKHYFERCFIENPDGEWAHTRYAAGWDLVNWFVHLWQDPSVPRLILHELKEWLAKLYKEGTSELRVAIITAALEHLFEHHDIEKYFSDWKRDITLKPAYEEAVEYATQLKREE